MDLIMKKDILPFLGVICEEYYKKIEKGIELETRKT